MDASALADSLFRTRWSDQDIHRKIGRASISCGDGDGQVWFCESISFLVILPFYVARLVLAIHWHEVGILIDWLFDELQMATSITDSQGSAAGAISPF